MARFYNHQIFGTADSFPSAGERINDTLNIGLPDDEITAPIGAWHHASVSEFGAPLAADLMAMEAE